VAPEPNVVAVPVVAAATAIATGHQHICAIVAGGAAKCWGAGGSGQLGNDATPANSAPVDVVGLAGATAIAAGGNSTCAVLTTGALMCWGANDMGQLGNPAATGKTPSLVFGF